MSLHAASPIIAAPGALTVNPDRDSARCRWED